MYNPFPLLNESLLNDKIQKGKKYFVRQTFGRGIEPRIVAAFLFRAYDAEEKELAEHHLASLKKDGNAFLYQVDNAEHLAKLHIAAKQPFGYRIFYAGKHGEEWKPPIEYQDKMRQYISRHHPGWKTKPGGDKIEIGLYEEFGELFLKLSFEGEEEKVRFEEIEKY